MGRGAARGIGRFDAAPVFLLGALEVPEATGSLRGRLPLDFQAGGSDSATSSSKASDSLVQLAMKRLMKESDSPFPGRRAPRVAVEASVSLSDSGTISKSTPSHSAR